MVNARKIAFEAILKLERDAAFSNLTLDGFLSRYDMEPRDKALVSALFYGVIESKITLDYNLSLYLQKPLAKRVIAVALVICASVIRYVNGASARFVKDGAQSVIVAALFRQLLYLKSDSVCTVVQRISDKDFDIKRRFCLNHAGYKRLSVLNKCRFHFVTFKTTFPTFSPR